MRVIVYMYIFVFACLLKANAITPAPKTKSQSPITQTQQQAQAKDCIKHPQIVKTSLVTAPKTIEKQKVITPEKLAKTNQPVRPNYNNSHYSVLNFINFFYTKDTLDNLHVM